MRKACVALVVGALASVATAKPLPSGMSISLKKGKPFLTMQGVTVQLEENLETWSDVKAELSDDDKELQVWSARCGMELDPEERPLKLSLAVVGAKIANAKGAALQTKKKFGDSAKLFEQAWKADASSPVYATNYLAALSMGKQVDQASKFLESGIAKDFIAWFGWRLAVDPALRAVAATDAGKAFRAPKAGKLSVKKLGEGGAVSPLGVAAMTTVDSSKNVYLSFVQLSSGRETLRLPIKTTAQIQQADKVLQAMGFEASPNRRVLHSDAKKLASTADAADIKAAVDLGTDVIYMYRTAGCDAAEFEGHVGAIKVPAPAPTTDE